jgi:hypothetical protein
MDDLALHTDPSTVNDANFIKAATDSLVEILLHNNGYFL